MIDEFGLEDSGLASGHAWSHGQRILVMAADGTAPAAVLAASAQLGCSVRAMVHDLPTLAEQVADIVWAVPGDEPAAGFLAGLSAHVHKTGQGLVLDIDERQIDAVCRHFGTGEGEVILVRPDAVDCVAAIAQLVVDNRPAMASAVRETGQIDQINRLQDEVRRIATALARLSMDGGERGRAGAAVAIAPPSPFIEDHVAAAPRGYDAGPAFGQAVPVGGATAARVRRMIRDRRLREQIFPAEYFADPAWDMMLDLFAARLERRRVAVSSLCIAAAVPATTALRWIKTLTDAGLFVRRDDQSDGRRIFVELSDGAMDAMRSYFERLDIA